VIEVFADVLCPFTHVGLERLVQYRDAIGSDEILRVKAWPLELVNGEPLAASLVADEIAELRREVAPDLFRGFTPATFPRSSLAPLALATAAYGLSSRAGEQVSLALRRALFEDGLDVSSADVLAAIREAHDLGDPPVDTEQVLVEWREGQRRGVEGSPYFFVRGEGFFCPTLRISHVGDRLHVERDDAALEHFLDRAFA
jgi:predicted DsbA family dithiol-disulfide isomerase